MGMGESAVSLTVVGNCRGEHEDLDGLNEFPARLLRNSKHNNLEPPVILLPSQKHPASC